MTDFTKLGKYEIRRELGRGAMGVVYEAFDPLIERVVALKTIRPDQLEGALATEIQARFRREAQAAGRLSHPNIVAIYDFGEDAGVWYIAMELVQGRELKEYFEASQRFSLAETLRIVGQILAALGYSHQAGVVHRDIKPSNIFILPNGTVKVADFGIAHLESSELTQVGSVLGTPAYMSPEQILGLPVDGRSDLFSVGVILYQFLAGERPFAGSATVTMRKVLEEDPLPPSRFNVQLPGAMDAVLRRALAKKPEQRFPSAAEFAAALEAAVRVERESTGETTLAPPPAGPAPAVAAPGSQPAGIVAAGAAASAALGAAKTDATAAPASQRSAMVLVIAMLALAIGAGVWFFWPRHAGSQDAAAPSPAANASASSSLSSGVAGPTAVMSTAAPSTAPTPAGSTATAPNPAPTAVNTPAKTDPGHMVISAVGWVDPSTPGYQSDPAKMQSDLRADSRGQLIEKAIALLLDKASLNKNYSLLQDRLLPKSGDYVTQVVRESAPQTGKNGLVSITTEAVVNVKAVQKSLNEMSRDERIDFIRASGDPKVAVRIAARDADLPDAPPQAAPAAENVLKERIKSFGFRTWSEEAPRSDTQATPEFVVEGEVKIKRLSMRLPASGLVITKYGLNAWTIKCTDRATGEEIYYNTALPAGEGSWATEEDAYKAIGTGIANEFTRDFFLQHLSYTGQRVKLKFDGLPTSVADDALRQEIVALPAVITMAPAAQARAIGLQLAGDGPLSDLVAADVLAALNAKLGQACFSIGAVAGEDVGVVFAAPCQDPAVLARLETNPPAALYGAPQSRQKAVVKNPDTLKKLMV